MQHPVLGTPNQEEVEETGEATEVVGAKRTAHKGRLRDLALFRQRRNQPQPTTASRAVKKM